MLGEAMKNAAMAAKLPFFDAAEVITTDGIDSVHLTAETHRKLGEAVAHQVSIVLRSTKQL
jgi:hypothetical protein